MIDIMPTVRYARERNAGGALMGETLKLATVGALAFMVLDGLWLGVLMKNFYRDQLAPIVRLSDGGIAPNWPAALVVYALLGAGIALFVIPRAPTLGSAAGYGALFGLVVYGVYDFTNYSTLRQWPFVLTVADVAWAEAAAAASARAVPSVLASVVTPRTLPTNRASNPSPRRGGRTPTIAS